MFVYNVIVVHNYFLRLVSLIKVCATIGTQHWIYNVTDSPPVSLYKEWQYNDVNRGKQQGMKLIAFKIFIFHMFLTLFFLIEIMQMNSINVRETFCLFLGGYLTKFKDHFSFMTIRHAGHEVPAYQPQKALELFKRYLDGSLF